MIIVFVVVVVVVVYKHLKKNEVRSPTVNRVDKAWRGDVRKREAPPVPAEFGLKRLKGVGEEGSSAQPRSFPYHKKLKITSSPYLSHKNKQK